MVWRNFLSRGFDEDRMMEEGREWIGNTVNPGGDETWMEADFSSSPVVVGELGSEVSSTFLWGSEIAQG